MGFLDIFSAALPKEIPFENLKPLVAPEKWQDDPESAAILSLIRSGKFDTLDYIKRYPDVQEKGLDPIYHFVIYGILEKRFFKCLSKLDKQCIATNEEIHIYTRKYIVSLTTYSFRIRFVHKTIHSLLNQSINNYTIILYLDKNEFSMRTIPNNLRNLISAKFKIKFCDNLGSLKKIFFALKQYPNNPIVTADDDIVYDYDWLEKLTSAYEKNSNFIYCHRCHRIKLDNDVIMPYKQWKQRHDIVSCSYLNFPTSGGGVLFPPKSLHEEFFNIEKYKEICFNRDDIWLWAMAVLNKTKIHIVPHCNKDIKIINEVKKHLEDKPLWKQNVTGGLNDISINHIQQNYPHIINIIKTEFNELYPIVFICDDNYIRVLVILITSIMNTKHAYNNYKFFFLADRISAESKSLLRTLSYKFCFEYEIIDCNAKYLDRFYIDNGYCTARPLSLLKFEIPNILKHHKKVLYMDCDIIVRKDISSLFKYDIDKYYLAAVLDSGILYSQRKLMNDNYFNSGVMLMNLEKMRQENKTKQLYDMKQKISTKLMDQDILNMVFSSDVLYLPIAYNTLYTNLMRAQGKFSVDDINKKYSTSYKDLDELFENSCILHFASKEKPWLYDDVIYSAEWYAIYKSSILSNFPLLRQKYKASQA